MKLFLPFVIILAAAVSLFAGEFRTLFINARHPGIHIEEGEFMLIRNFTQDQTGNTRGVVMFSRHDPGDFVNVFSASIQDPTATPPEEVINSVIVAGPGVVTFQCGEGARCLATFKVDSNN